MWHLCCWLPPLHGWALSLLALHQPSAAQGSAGTSPPLLPGPHSPARTASSKMGSCRDKDRQEHPSLSLLFFHNQNSPVLFRVIRLGLCSKPCSVWRGSGSGSTADGGGGWPHNGTEFLSWRRAEHHPHGTTWPHPGPHSDGRDQARGGVSSAGTCPTPAHPGAQHSTQTVHPPQWMGRAPGTFHSPLGECPWSSCVSAQRSQSQG